MGVPYPWEVGDMGKLFASHHTRRRMTALILSLHNPPVFIISLSMSLSFFSMNYYDTEFFIIFIEHVPMVLVSMVSDEDSLFKVVPHVHLPRGSNSYHK